MSNWNKPDAASNYSTEYFTELNAKFDALSKLDYSGITSNILTNAIRWSPSNSRFEIYSGASWGELDTEYEINVTTFNGQAASFYQNAGNLTAGTLPAARFNDTSHGNRSGGALHSAATTTVNGFMSSADKTKLDGVATGAEVNAADASQAEMEAGTEAANRSMSPLRVSQAIAALGKEFNSGVVMVFFQASAPTGWTQVTTHNDKALRVVSSAGGGSGGTAAFSTPAHSLSGGAHTLTTLQMPQHSHTKTGTGFTVAYPSGGGGNYNRTSTANENTGNAGSSNSHSHTISGSITTPQYIDVIVASKN